MTRINVVPVEELSDQWLLAEYRELPRVIKGEFDISDAPDRYCLGKGHVKWAKKYACWTTVRYLDICNEMEYRGFRVNYPGSELYKLWNGEGDIYLVSCVDISINKNRLIKKYKLKPNYYKWTKREKPQWLN